MIKPGVFDGVILLNAVELETLIAPERPSWMAHLAHIPLVRIGLPSPFGASIEVENQHSSRQLMSHLITEHQCQTIAFIAGINHHPNAQAREQMYLESLEQHQLPILPELRVQGNFSRQSGRVAMGQLLDSFHGQLDAVFAANDEMALGAIETLWERGFDVPNDVKVVGFDDIQEGQVWSSPLTTIRQPLYALGQHALEMVLQHFQTLQHRC